MYIAVLKRQYDMKVALVKYPGGMFGPADEVAEEQLKKLKNCSHYSADIKVDHNYKLLQKLFVFCKFCAQNYYGDQDVNKDQIELVRKKLTMSAGYCKQIWLPDGVRFELVPLSISYDKMTPEERWDFYNKLVNAALKNIFHTFDESTFNKLMLFL